MPGSVRFHVNVGAGFQTGTIVEDAPGEFIATFPPAPCGQRVEYYMSYEASVSGMQTHPASVPANYHEVTARLNVQVAFDDMEVETGWTAGVAGDTATGGQWVRVNPNGTAAAPEHDHTSGGATRCFVTGQGTVGGAIGEADVDGGTTTLLSPLYDMSAMLDPEISYWLWYSNDLIAAQDDVFVAEISNDGGASWTLLEQLPMSTGGWVQRSFRVFDFVGLSAQVRVRFQASDLGVITFVEAAIDDFAIEDQSCPPCWSYAYCSSEPNSTGEMARLVTESPLVVSLNQLHLVASALPANQNGLFFYGAATADTPFGNGVKCVGGALFRLPLVNTGALGRVDFHQDLSQPPSGGQILPGSTWHYQLWYRDPAAGGAAFNLSEGVAALFCP